MRRAHILLTGKRGRRYSRTLPFAYPPAGPASTPATAIDLFANPFKAASAHHRPVGAGASFGAAGHAYTVAMLVNGPPNLNAGQGFAGGFVVMVENSPSDTILTVSWDGTGSGLNLPISLHLPTITTNAGQDAVVIVYDKASELFYEFYQFAWNSGAPTATMMRSYDPRGLGHPSTANNDRVGVSASGSAIAMGLVRGTELAASTPIGHLLQCTLANQSGATNQQLSASYAWPAFYVDSYCSNPINCIGAIPYGTPFAIPSTTAMPGGLTSIGQRLFAQMRDYGVRPIDGASNNAHCRGDHIVTNSQRNDFVASMVTLWPLLRPILNDSESDTTTGGGAAIATNTAWDA